MDAVAEPSAGETTSINMHANSGGNANRWEIFCRIPQADLSVPVAPVWGKSR